MELGRGQKIEIRCLLCDPGSNPTERLTGQIECADSLSAKNAQESRIAFLSVFQRLPCARGNRRSAASGRCSKAISRKCPDWRARQCPSVGRHNGGQESPAPTHHMEANNPGRTESSAPTNCSVGADAYIGPPRRISCNLSLRSQCAHWLRQSVLPGPCARVLRIPTSLRSSE